MLEKCRVSVKGFASQVIIEFRVMLFWFPTLMKKDKIPKRISILNGWMEFDLGALGLCKCLCFVESWVFFHAWSIGWFILAFFVFFETVHVLLRFPSWIFVIFFISFVILTNTSYRSLWKTKKLWWFFFLQVFQLQILQLRSVSWYFPTKKESCFLRSIFLLLVSKKKTSGKTRRNSSWFFVPWSFFFGGGPTSISPPPLPTVFWSPKKKQLGKKFVLWKFRQDHRKKLAVEISPVNLGGESLPCWGWVWWKGNRSSVVWHDGVSGLVGSFRIGHV